MRRLAGYAAFARTALRDHLRHRLRTAMRFVSCLFFMIVFVEFWRLIGRENLAALPWPVKNIAWYAALTQMFFFISPRLFMVIDEDVRSGNVAYFLTRPIPYLWIRLAEGIGAMTGNVLINYTAGIAFLYLYMGELPTGGWPALLAALLLMYAASVVHLLFQITAGITAFWLQDADAVYRIYHKFLVVLGGLYMPVAMYPAWLQKIAAWTPFYAMVCGAAQPLLEGESRAAMAASFGMMAFWLVFALVLLQGVYAICLRKIDVNGG